MVVWMMVAVVVVMVRRWEVVMDAAVESRVGMN